MDKEKRNAEVSINYNDYAIRSLKENVTQLEIINTICKEASNASRVIARATIKMKPASSIFTNDHKSL